MENGLNRKSKYKSCFTGDKFTPLWDLTNELENEIYKEYGIEIPPIYEKVNRTGCMGCPYGSWKHDTEKEIALLSPSQRKFVCEYFKESYKVLGIERRRIRDRGVVKGTMKFCFGDIVVVDENLIGVIVKSWVSYKGKTQYIYEVYVREYNSIQPYEENKIERYMVRHKYLDEEELEYQRNAMKNY